MLCTGLFLVTAHSLLYFITVYEIMSRFPLEMQDGFGNVRLEVNSDNPVFLFFYNLKFSHSKC